MKIKNFEELDESGKFPDLDTKLNLALEGILSGEFKKEVHVKEIALSKESKMLKGRQIAWMILNHFKISDV